MFIRTLVDICNVLVNKAMFQNYNRRNVAHELNDNEQF